MSKQKTLRRMDAVDMLGRAMFEDEYVDCLSRREWWLIDSYRSPSFDDEFTFLKYSASLPIVPPALRDELDRAIDRQAWLESQLDNCHNWLINMGFPADIEEIDLQQFEDLFAKHFNRSKPNRLSIPTKASAEAFAREYLGSNETPTLVKFRGAARSKFRGGRAILDEAYRSMARQVGISLKPGPRRNVPENAAE